MTVLALCRIRLCCVGSQCVPSLSFLPALCRWQETVEKVGGHAEEEFSIVQYSEGWGRRHVCTILIDASLREDYFVGANMSALAPRPLAQVWDICYQPRSTSLIPLFLAADRESITRNTNTLFPPSSPRRNSILGTP